MEGVDFHDSFNVGPYLNNDIAIAHIKKGRQKKGRDDPLSVLLKFKAKRNSVIVNVKGVMNTLSKAMNTLQTILCF